jgi:hypothetical protein
MIRGTVSPWIFAAGVVVALACGTSAPGGETDASTGALGCEHGTYEACACPDGTMGTQLCDHDTSGFEACMCGGNSDAASDSDPSGVATTTATTADDGVEASSGGAVTSGDPTATTDASSDGVGSSDASSGGVVGQPPTAMINHPGPEDRQAGVPIPFIGVANDPEDGALAGMALQWTDDVEGMIGEGEQFDAALDVLGEHTVTLTAMDGDGNIGEATVTFTIVP